MCRMLIPLLCAVLATSVYSTSTVCPKIEAAFGKFVSSEITSGIYDTGCQNLYTYIKNGTSFSNTAEGLYNSLSSKVLSLTAFYSPALKLYSSLSNWKTVLSGATTQIKKVCKPYYNNKLLKKKPASTTALDKKISGWIIKKVVKGAMNKIKGVTSAADWKLILTNLWDVVEFSNCGFTKP